MDKRIFKKIDDAIKKVYDELDYVKYLTPINYTEENDKFKEAYLNNRIYQPQYKYRLRSIDYDALHSIIDNINIPNNLYGDLYKKLIDNIGFEIELYKNIGSDEHFTEASTKVNGVPNEIYIGRAYADLNIEKVVDKKDLLSKDVREVLKKCLEEYSFKWKIIESDTMASKVTVDSNQKKLYINSKQSYSKNDIKRLSVHEISTHILRAENGRKKEFNIFCDGTFGSLSTEEGLAVYNEYISNSINANMLKLYAARFICSYNIDRQSYYEMVKEIEPSIGLDNAIYVVSRIKRGISNTGKPGGYNKDFVYLQGYYDVSEAIRKDPQLYNKLYFGCISLDNLSILETEIHNAQCKGDIIIPKKGLFYD